MLQYAKRKTMHNDDVLQNSLIQLKALQDFSMTIKSSHKELEEYIRVMEEYIYTSKLIQKELLLK